MADAENTSTSSKTCTKCGEIKSFSEFGRHRKGKYGLCQRCKVCTREDDRLRYAADLDRSREESRRTYQKHRATIAVRQKAYTEKNLDRIKARLREYYVINASTITAKSVAWKRANPDRVRGQEALRRSRKNKAGGRHSAEDIRQILNLQKARCAICKVKVEIDYHVDHVIPLARDGSNDRSNLQILCKTCNCRKGSKDPITHMQGLGFLL